MYEMAGYPVESGKVTAWQDGKITASAVSRLHQD